MGRERVNTQPVALQYQSGQESAVPSPRPELWGECGSDTTLWGVAMDNTFLALAQRNNAPVAWVSIGHKQARSSAAAAIGEEERGGKSEANLRVRPRSTGVAGFHQKRERKSL